MPPAASPAASPLSRWKSLAMSSTVIKPLTAINTASKISLIECGPNDLKNCGPLSKPTA